MRASFTSRLEKEEDKISMLNTQGQHFKNTCHRPNSAATEVHMRHSLTFTEAKFWLILSSFKNLFKHFASGDPPACIPQFCCGTNGSTKNASKMLVCMGI